MKSIKTGFVVVIMLAVAYGVWVMLNKKPLAPPGDMNIGWGTTPADSTGQTPWGPPQVEMGTPMEQPGHLGHTADSAAAPGTPGYTTLVPNHAHEGAVSPAKYTSPQDGSPAAPSAYASTPHAGQTRGESDDHSDNSHESRPTESPSRFDRGAEYEDDGSAPAEDQRRTGSIYGQGEDTSAGPPDYSGFNTAWRRGAEQLSRGQLAEALETLSIWYDSGDIPPDMQPEYVELLDQLAGTVIYSRQHFLERPYVVQQGETLEVIAARLMVPWELLANINGIDDPDKLQPGTELKAVRGPFSAEINLETKVLTVMLNRMYAGRFAVELGNDPQPMSGEYTVKEKELQRTFYTRRGDAIAPGDDQNPYGPCWIGLQGRLGIHGAAEPPRDGDRESTGSIIVDPSDARDLYAILSKDSTIIIRR